MKYYIINLERRRDRLELFVNERCPKKLLKKVTVFHAIDGKNEEAMRNYNITENTGLTFENLEDLFMGNDFENKPAFMGNALSHLTLWNMCANQPGETAVPFMIFEDDVRFCNDFYVKIKTVFRKAPGDFDLIYVGGGDYLPEMTNAIMIPSVFKRIQTNHIEGEPINEFFGRPRNPCEFSVYMIQCYIVSPKGAKKLLQKAQEQRITQAMDSWLKDRAWTDLKVYNTIPLLCYSRRDETDECQVNYGQVLEENIA